MSSLSHLYVCMCITTPAYYVRRAKTYLFHSFGICILDVGCCDLICFGIRVIYLLGESDLILCFRICREKIRKVFHEIRA